uniref:Uncharacterized protein n=1 Tax=Micrurus spixii TaxID=129469 RepID=A0A2D4N1H9_9SAUR
MLYYLYEQNHLPPEPAIEGQALDLPGKAVQQGNHLPRSPPSWRLPNGAGWPSLQNDLEGFLRSLPMHAFCDPVFCWTFQRHHFTFMDRMPDFRCNLFRGSLGSLSSLVLIINWDSSGNLG